LTVISYRHAILPDLLPSRRGAEWGRALSAPRFTFGTNRKPSSSTSALSIYGAVVKETVKLLTREFQPSFKVGDYASSAYDLIQELRSVAA